MPLFELVIVLLLGGAVLVAFSQRIGVPYPALLALAGAVAAVLPGAPAVRLEPDLALTLFVAPVLLDAAFDSSPRDIRDNWLPIGMLAVVVVVLTTAAVAVVARGFLPGLPWAAAVALGAIVAPSDASAAGAVLGQMRPPHRVLTILQGESLLNDATALLIYRLAVGAAAGGATSGWAIAPTFLLTAGGGAVLGWLLARLWRLIPTDHADIPVGVLMQFLATFAVWILADHLRVSAIITTVVYGMSLARAPLPGFDARRRRTSFAVWEVVTFVLNVLAFILVGLQLKTILGRLDGGLTLYLGVAGSICLTVIAVRVAWVMAANAAVRLKIRRYGEGGGRKLAPPTARGGLVISWCGMRGIVTLATALALPDRFPERGLLVFCAFAVVMGTLAIQGLTLRPLLALLRLPEDTAVDDEIRLAREATARAAMALLRDGASSGPASEARQALYREYAARAVGEPATPARGSTLAEWQGEAVAAQRRTLLRLRHDGTIGDDAFHVIEEELDILELTADPRIRSLQPSQAMERGQAPQDKAPQDKAPQDQAP